MSLKLELLKWAVKIFGEDDLGDLISIREEVVPTKDEKVNIKSITLFVKKHLGLKKNWGEQSVLDGWRQELRKIVGDHLKFSMKPVEGIGRKYISGIKEDLEGKEHYIEEPSAEVYNFQLNFEIAKRVRRKTNANVKRRIPKRRKV